MARDRIDDIAGVGAVADIVAEEDEALHMHPPRVVEAGVERLPIGVDVGEKGNQHRRRRRAP